MNHAQAYRAPLEDIRFLLWEQNSTEETVLPFFPYLTREAVDAVLDRAVQFAEQKLGTCYQSADAEECWLDADGVVHIPSAYPALLEAFRADWGQVLKPRPNGGMGLPAIVQYALLELFMGANPAFMTYVGFNGPALQLLSRYGTVGQQSAYADALSCYRWTSCLCTTEADAGSDLSRIVTSARKQPDGRYLITGEKRFISAGMHEMTENIVYFVLARVVGAPAGMLGLSCFIVPRFIPDQAGAQFPDNHVRCREVVQKMGLKGCANTHLTFGASGPCYGLLMGERENIGLMQLMNMMTPARISTGIYALGMASSAYLNALHYARHRIQGKQFDRSMSSSAPSLAIASHPDVRRMLLQMKALTEGCRAMVAKLGLAETQHQIELSDATVSREKQKGQHGALFEFLTPLVKAYCSNQAWSVAETAIQVFGGNGYLRKYPVEQYARDCKVLSIWEGTNHIQAQFLLRENLGMGVRETTFSVAFFGALDGFLQDKMLIADFPAQHMLLSAACDSLRLSLKQLGVQVKNGHMLAVPACANVLLDMVSEIVVCWSLLEGACRAKKVLRTYTADSAQVAFYREKIECASFFAKTVMPLTVAKYQVVNHLLQPDSFPDMTADSSVSQV